MTKQQVDDDVKLVSPTEARAMTGGISASTQERLIARGLYPKPIVLSRNSKGRPARCAFVYAELVSWNKAKIAEHRGAAA